VAPGWNQAGTTRSKRRQRTMHDCGRRQRTKDDCGQSKRRRLHTSAGGGCSLTATLHEGEDGGAWLLHTSAGGGVVPYTATLHEEEDGGTCVQAGTTRSKRRPLGMANHASVFSAQNGGRRREDDPG